MVQKTSILHLPLTKMYKLLKITLLQLHRPHFICPNNTKVQFRRFLKALVCLRFRFVPANPPQSLRQLKQTPRVFCGMHVPVDRADDFGFLEVRAGRDINRG